MWSWKKINVCTCLVCLLIFDLLYNIYSYLFLLLNSNSLLKDLESANEYLVGATLRFISKITDKEILG
jgi:hypothetical protein